MKNPRVEFNLNELQKNIDILKKETSGIQFLFPVKCCNHPSVLEIIYNNDFGFDVSNSNELNIVGKYLDGRFVSGSGPLSYELENFEYNNLHIVANNLNSYSFGKGVRISFNSNSDFEFSRFGEDINNITEKEKVEIKYIHFHNSDHKDKSKCTSILKNLPKVINEFPNLEYLNIGGHLEDLDIVEGIAYLNRVREIVPKEIILLVELGDFLFKGVGILYCKVVDVRRDINTQVVTLNFSKMANQRWAYPKYFDNSTDKIKTIFYGCSCCETDIYLKCESKELNVGDSLTFYNISPYSYQWDTSFNGVEKMEYIFKNL